jgi:hypothetical protein
MMTITYAQAKAQGLKRYRTGKTCRAGHMAERYVLTRNCVECDRKNWRAVRDQLGHNIVTAKLRVPTGQLPERIAFWLERVQQLTDKYFAADA